MQQNWYIGLETEPTKVVLRFKDGGVIDEAMR
jgi:hypothetical protein